MKPQRILLVRVGKVPDWILEGLVRELREILGAELRVEERILTLPPSSSDRRRGQYKVSAILEHVRTVLSTRAFDRVLGITDVDLFAPGFNFVFGQAEFGGRFSVISICRLDPRFYRLPPDDSLFLGRAVKEAVHELGHTFWLEHCDNPRCVMHFSNTIYDTDEKEKYFCQSCKTELE